jgi:ABC-type oligopeptide transport system ATPase subunit
MNNNIILEVNDLKQHFPIRQGFLQRVVGHVKAVDGISFTLREQEVLGLVGESGCGKTTTGRAILRLYDPTAGEVWFRKENGERVEISHFSQQQMKPIRREMRMIFQDPFSSLNPRLTVRDIIAEGWRVHRGVVAPGRWTVEVKDLMERVGLNPDYADRYPHQFSGGQRQRIGIARALALRPKLIICDEAVSALDVSVQAQVLNLLEDLQADLGLSYLFISHDLSVIQHICDRVLVLNKGVVVEEGTALELFENPQDDYTRALLAAVPVVRPWLTETR